jgi:ribonuclease P protein component
VTGAYRWSRFDRLRRRQDFVAIQSAGTRVHGKHFVVLVAQGAGRVGITVSKKVGNAVTRNRLKRFIREFVRQARWDGGRWAPADCDLVVVAKKSASGIDAAEVAADLLNQRDRVASC